MAIGRIKSGFISMLQQENCKLSADVLADTDISNLFDLVAVRAPWNP